MNGSSLSEMRISVLSVFAVLLSVVSLTYAHPLSDFFLTPRADTPILDDHCATVADNDLYGRGVRIGMYLQWAAGFVLRNLDETWDARSRVRTNTNVLASAVALATVISICRGTALSVDCLLSYYLTVVLFYAESYNLEIRDDKDFMGRGNQELEEPDRQTLELHADLPLVFQNVYFTAFTLFGAWYWLKGIDLTVDPECGGKAALLGVFDIRNRTWTHAAATLAIIAGVLFFMVSLLHLSSLRDGIASGAKLVAVAYAGIMYEGSGPAPTKYDIKMGLKRLLKPWIYLKGLLIVIPQLIHYFLIYLTGPLIAIVSVERMVMVNHLVTASAFSSAGQIIALFTGIASILLTCWELGSKWWKSKTRDGGNGHSKSTEQAKKPEPVECSVSSLKKDAPAGSDSAKKLDTAEKKETDIAAQVQVIDEVKIEEAE